MSRPRLVPAIVAALILTGLNGCAASGGHADADGELSMDQLPAPVRATLQREVGGGRIEEIAKNITEGKTVYSADVTIGDKTWDIVIAEDGTLLNKEED